MWELKECQRERKKRRGRMEFWRILTFMVPYEAVKEKDSHPGMKWKGAGLGGRAGLGGKGEGLGEKGRGLAGRGGSWREGVRLGGKGWGLMREGRGLGKGRCRRRKVRQEKGVDVSSWV